MPLPKMPPVQYEFIKLKGGLDLITPTLMLPPGVARDATNWEASVTGGYTRIAGYERYDGQPNPSSAAVSTFTASITGAIAVGDTLTGGTSGATGYVIDVDGSLVAYTKATGSFVAAENILVSATPQGTVTLLGSVAGLTAEVTAQYQNLAADAYRSDIAAVPGSGTVRGVAYYGGDVYAWRDNAGGTALDMYVSTPAGWSQISFGEELYFSTGTAEIVEGVTLTGQTSGATGVVLRTIVQSGSWGTAAGKVIFASTTGTFQNGENLRVAGVTKAVAVGAEAAITFLPGGRIETVTANFGGGTATTYLYAVDGVNRAFEFDGTSVVPIDTTMPTDTPSHLAFHKAKLFLSFSSSVQFSSAGDPHMWSPVVGAGEIALVGDVTAFQVLPGDQSTGAMAVYGDDNTFILYGSDETDFNLVSFVPGTGAKAFTAQNLAGSYVFDDRGVIDLQTSQNYGNFDSNALTYAIRPFTQQRRTLAVASGVNREKSQYRVFFSDGAGLYLTFINGKYAGAMPVQFNVPVMCACEGEKTDGFETTFFGSTNGMVYRLDAGTSFDGEDISATLQLSFDAVRSPRIKKRWRKASLEVSGTAYAQFQFSTSMAYGTTAMAQNSNATYTTSLASSYWDDATWDAFVWDGTSLAPSEIELQGTAENISVLLSSTSDYYESFTINSLILHYTPRVGLR